MDTVKLHEALVEANRGLSEVSTQFESLQLKKAQLQSVVASLSALLGELLPASSISGLPPVVSVMTPKNSENKTKDDSAPLWSIAQNLLLETNRIMTVPQMMAIFSDRGHTFNGDGLRVAMLRRKDIFNNPAYAKYGLVAWEKEKAEEEAFSFHRENETAAA